MGWWIALWILLGLIGIITLLMLLPVGVRVRYQDEVLKMWCTAGPVRVLLYPPKKNKKKKKDRDSKVTIDTVFAAQIKANQRYQNALGKFMAELKILLDLFGAMRPRICMKRLEIKLVLAGSDSGAVAIQYGGAWAAVGCLYPILDGSFRIKKHDISVDCDFSDPNGTRVEAKLDITIGLGRLLYCLLRFMLKTSP